MKWTSWGTFALPPLAPSIDWEKTMKIEKNTIGTRSTFCYRVASHFPLATREACPRCSFWRARPSFAGPQPNPRHHGVRETFQCFVSTWCYLCSLFIFARFVSIGYISHTTSTPCWFAHLSRMYLAYCSVYSQQSKGRTQTVNKLFGDIYWSSCSVNLPFT